MNKFDLFFSQHPLAIKIALLSMLGLATLIFSLSAKISKFFRLEIDPLNIKDKIARLKKNKKWFRNQNTLELIGALGIFLLTILQLWVTDRVENINRKEIDRLTNIKDSSYQADLKANTNENFRKFSEISANEYRKQGYKLDSVTGKLSEIDKSIQEVNSNAIPEPRFLLLSDGIKLQSDIERHLNIIRVTLSTAESGAILNSYKLFVLRKFDNSIELADEGLHDYGSNIQAPIGTLSVELFYNAQGEQSPLNSVTIGLFLKYQKDKRASPKLLESFYRYIVRTDKTILLKDIESTELKTRYKNQMRKTIYGRSESK